MEDLEDGDERTTHSQSQDTAYVGNEPDEGDALISLDLSHCWIFDVDVDQGQVLTGVAVQCIHQGLESKDERSNSLRGK